MHFQPLQVKRWFISSRMKDGLFHNFAEIICIIQYSFGHLQANLTTRINRYRLMLVPEAVIMATDNNDKSQNKNKVVKQADLTEVLEVASKAGHILLENGAEISRVEDIMSRIASHFGVDSGNFFVLSNGIFTTGHANKVSKSGGQASTYANVEFIPIRGIQL